MQQGENTRGMAARNRDKQLVEKQQMIKSSQMEGKEKKKEKGSEKKTLFRLT